MDMQMAMNKQNKQPRALDTKLKNVADHLNALLSEHKVCGEDMRVVLQDDPNEWYALIDVVHHSNHDVNELSLVYKSSLGEKFSTGFTSEQARGIKIEKYGISGADFDGEWVRVVGRVQATGDGKSQRSITSVKAIDGAKKTAAKEVKRILAAAPLIPSPYARAAVFNVDPLGRFKVEGGPWEIHTPHIHVKSEHPRLHQDHRCLMDYLIAQATKYGLTFIAPAPKIMNCMNMRFTKHSITYGKAAMQALHDTVVQSKMLVGGVSQWVELRFIEAFEWGNDGAVRVTVSPSAVSTFKPAVRKEVRAQLIRVDGDWWPSWLAGFVANNEGVILTKEELKQLVHLPSSLQRDIFGMLTKVPDSADFDEYNLWVDPAYSRAESRLRNAELSHVLWNRRETRNPEELIGQAAAEFLIQKTRMTEKIQSGMFLTDRHGTIAWRLREVDCVEIVPFEQSGLSPEKVLSF